MTSIIDLYFDWLVDKVCYGVYKKNKSKYSKLLYSLFEDCYFEWTIPRDENRTIDGINLRTEFLEDINKNFTIDDLDEFEDYFDPHACTILELMISLSLRCETTIMSDDIYGNRTGMWFWSMIASLELDDQDNEYFDIDIIHQAIDRFNRRVYEPNGQGGLFTIPETIEDMRDVELWCQMCWYLNYIIEKGE